MAAEDYTFMDYMRYVVGMTRKQVRKLSKSEKRNYMMNFHSWMQDKLWEEDFKAQ